MSVTTYSTCYRVWIYFDLPIEFHYFLSKVLMLSPELHIKESSKYAQKHMVYFDFLIFTLFGWGNRMRGKRIKRKKIKRKWRYKWCLDEKKKVRKENIFMLWWGEGINVVRSDFFFLSQSHYNFSFLPKSIIALQKFSGITNTKPMKSLWNTFSAGVVTKSTRCKIRLVSL